MFTLGPPAADDTLREAIAWGLERAVDIEGVHVTDPAFAGSDTLATAKALAAALTREGPFDLVLAGRNSVDADTGQVGPELAELLDLPFLTGVRYLAIEGTRVDARCEHDDGWMQAEVELPAVLSCAERLTEPSKVDPPGRAAVPADRIRRLSAADLGPGPWGVDASPTTVGPVKVMEVTARAARARRRAARRTRCATQCGSSDRAARCTTPRRSPRTPRCGGASAHGQDPSVVGRRRTRPCAHDARAARRGDTTRRGDRHVRFAVITVEEPNPVELGAWGADEVVHLRGANVEEDVARAIAEWTRTFAAPTWAIIVGSTAWGREVASRVAARLGAGLTGDAVDLEVSNGRLVAWKPAFGGQLVAAIEASSPIQMATVRAGMLTAPTPRIADSSRTCGSTTCHPAVASACSRAPARTTSTRSPTRPR